MNILDAATLEQLHTFNPQSLFGWLSFSPDSRLLTQFGNNHQEITTWDLQTGGRISTIPPTSHNIRSECFSSTYSTDGKVVAVAYKNKIGKDTGISIYNLLSGTHTYSHRVLEGRVVASIWTHDECLRFITVKPGTITVWQVGFASVHTLASVESFPTPDDINYSEDALFLPTRSLLAFPRLGIWDVRDSKLLLKIQGRGSSPKMSFSSDGRFFMYGDSGTTSHLWEESPAGYVLRQKLVPSIGGYRGTLLSPNGKSIVSSVHCETQLLRTTDPVTSLSNVPARPIGTKPLLDFSPDGSFVATAWWKDNMATVLDLRSGNRLIIDTRMEIYSLWMTGNTITVFDGGRIVAWDLSAGGHALNTRATINDSVRTIVFGLPTPLHDHHLPSAAISPDFSYIVITWKGEGGQGGYHLHLGIFDMATGNHLAGATTLTKYGSTPWITPDGCEVWSSATRGWKIIKDTKSNVIGLERLPDDVCPSGGYPWESPHGRSVTDDGWIFNSRKKRLMWLPHRWRGGERNQVWGGQFLGLLGSSLPEPIIVELGK